MYSANFKYKMVFGRRINILQINIDLTSVDRDFHYIIETQEINKNNATK
jgi:hypothetical protein